MQEHKQSSKATEMPAAQAWCKKLGFAHSFKEAITTAKEGRSSGVALLWNKHRQVRAAVNLEGAGPRLNAVYATVPGIGEVLIVTVYGISGLHEKNLVDALALASGVAEAHPNFMIIGDFNTSAKEANEAIRNSSLRASVISFGNTYHAIETDTDIDFAIVSASLMRAGIRASKHGHEETTLSKHDAIEIAISELDESEYVAVLDHKHKPETARVYGPKYQDNEQNAKLEREITEIWETFSLDKRSDISDIGVPNNDALDLHG